MKKKIVAKIKSVLLSCILLLLNNTFVVLAEESVLIISKPAEPETETESKAESRESNILINGLAVKDGKITLNDIQLCQYIVFPIDENDVDTDYDWEFCGFKYDISVVNNTDEALTGIEIEFNSDYLDVDKEWTEDHLEKVLSPAGEGKSLEKANEGTIRLRPTKRAALWQGEEGKSLGTLIIHTAEQDPVEIELNGWCDAPFEDYFDVYCIQYLPVEVGKHRIQSRFDDRMWKEINCSFSGKLPDGLQWIPERQEIYGVPLSEGEFGNATMDIVFTDYEGWTFKQSCEVHFIIDSNDDSYIYDWNNWQNRESYSLLDELGINAGLTDHVNDPDAEVVTENGTEVILPFSVIQEYGAQDMESRGPISDFIDVWLNGVKLQREVHYTVESDSSKITVKAETLASDLVKMNEHNTIAMEFRKDGDVNNELRSTAHNFTIDIKEQSETERKTRIGDDT